MRRVICHYHIFKNSGTSFDELLEKNYGDRFCTFDGPFPFFKISQEELTKVIRNVKAVAFSSHQISLPVPPSLDLDVLPVVFIRHPLLRIRSIYQFGKQSPESTPGGIETRQMSFEEWVMSDHHDLARLSSLSNEQTRRLGGVYGREPQKRHVPGKGFIADVCQALRNLAAVELLARTEFYDHDVKRFERILADKDLSFTFHDLKPSNTTSKDITAGIEERLDNVRDELGNKAYNMLLDFNQQDMELFEYTCRRLERAS